MLAYSFYIVPADLSSLLTCSVLYGGFIAIQELLVYAELFRFLIKT